MKVTMTEKEMLCGNNNDRLKNSWEYYTIANDAFLQGFKAAKKLLLETLEDSGYNQMDDPCIHYIANTLGDIKVEVEIDNHQLTNREI